MLIGCVFGSHPIVPAAVTSAPAAAHLDTRSHPTAIAVMMDMLSGVLSGSAFGSAVHGPYQTEYRSGAGQFMIALNVAAFQPVSDFGERMERYIAELKSVPLARGFDEIVYPGELEARNDARHRAEGLLLPDDTRADLQGLAEAYGLQSKLPF